MLVHHSITSNIFQNSLRWYPFIHLDRERQLTTRHKENTKPLSTDPLSTDPLSTDPLSTDPLTTDPLTTDPLSSQTKVQHNDHYTTATLQETRNYVSV